MHGLVNSMPFLSMQTLIAVVVFNLKASIYIGVPVDSIYMTALIICFSIPLSVLIKGNLYMEYFICQRLVFFNHTIQYIPFFKTNNIKRVEHNARCIMLDYLKDFFLVFITKLKKGYSCINLYQIKRGFIKVYQSIG